MSAHKNIPLNEMEIKAITFDLDDTLWPCAPVIALAEEAYYRWIEEHMPEVAQKYDLAQIIAMRKALAADEPELKNDVTELRRRATVDLLQPYGATEADMAEALRVCLSARQQVTLYDDSLHGLQQLAERYPLGAITNGNADLTTIGLKQYFAVELAATMQLPAKPAADMFVKVFETLNVEPQQVLHVGDHPLNDVAAARDVGCRTAWINRTNEAYPQDHQLADIQIETLHDLLALAS